MAIKIKSASGKGITGGVAGLPPTMQEVDIGVDTEAEILAFPAFGEPITDKYGVSAIPAELSIAHTPGYKEVYELSPSGVWTKM